MSNSTLKEEYINFIANEYLGILLIVNKVPLIAVDLKGNAIELYLPAIHQSYKCYYT